MPKITTFELVAVDYLMVALEPVDWKRGALLGRYLFLQRAEVDSLILAYCPCYGVNDGAQ